MALKFVHCQIFDCDTGEKIFDKKRRLYEETPKDNVGDWSRLLLDSFFRGCKTGRNLCFSLSVSLSDPVPEPQKLFEDVY